MRTVILLVLVAYGVLGVPLRDLDKEVNTHDLGVSPSTFRESHDAAEVQIKYLPPIKEDGSTNNGEIVQSARKSVETCNKPNENVNDVTQDHKIETNIFETPNQVPNTTNNAIKNSTELSKHAEELEFPDRIGTPAIISLQGPPGK